MVEELSLAGTWNIVGKGEIMLQRGNKTPQNGLHDIFFAVYQRRKKKNLRCQTLSWDSGMRWLISGEENGGIITIIMAQNKNN